MGYMLKFDLNFSLKQQIQNFFPDILMFKYNYPRVHGKEGNGKRKRKAESGNGKRKYLSCVKLTTITILCFFAVVKVDSRRYICKGVLWGSLSI